MTRTNLTCTSIFVEITISAMAGYFEAFQGPDFATLFRCRDAIWKLREPKGYTSKSVLLFCSYEVSVIQRQSKRLFQHLHVHSVSVVHQGAHHTSTRHRRRRTDPFSRSIVENTWHFRVRIVEPFIDVFEQGS